MLKFNFANLNNRFKSRSENTAEPNGVCAKQTEMPRQLQYPCSKPKYSAYRTVVARHEQFAARIKDRDQDQNPLCAEPFENNGCDCACEDGQGERLEK